MFICVRIYVYVQIHIISMKQICSVSECKIRPAGLCWCLNFMRIITFFTGNCIDLPVYFFLFIAINFLFLIVQSNVKILLVRLVITKHHQMTTIVHVWYSMWKTLCVKVCGCMCMWICVWTTLKNCDKHHQLTLEANNSKWLVVT